MDKEIKVGDYVRVIDPSDYYYNKIGIVISISSQEDFFNYKILIKNVCYGKPSMSYEHYACRDRRFLELYKSADKKEGFTISIKKHKRINLNFKL